MRRLPALDGLRGVAILLVLVSHSWTSSASDFWPHIGWSGVELFFVLSGFLITTILLEARGSAAYFRTFYARRILRIFPLYYTVIAVMFVMVAALPAVAKPELGIPRGHEWTYWLFLSNASMAVSGTFAFAAAGITWSLAVEEQFYLLWAPIVRFLRPRLLMLLSAGVYLTALVWRVALYGTHGWTLAGLVLLPSQMDALAAGAFVAIVCRDNLSRARAARWAPWIAAVSASALLMGAFRVGTFYSQDATTWVLGLSMYPLLYSSVLTMVVSGWESPLARVLSVPILRTFGRYSYAIYLLHRPLLIGMNIVGLSSLAQPSSSLVSQVAYTSILVTVGLSVGWASWCLLEQPAQRLKRLFEAGERGADARDRYTLEGLPALLTVGPWRFERPQLDPKLKAAAVRLIRLRPSAAMVLPGLVTLAMSIVFLTGPASARTTLPVTVLLLFGVIASVLLAQSRNGYLVAAALAGVVLSSTPHGPYLVAIGLIILAPAVLVPVQSRRLIGRVIRPHHSSPERLS